VTVAVSTFGRSPRLRRLIEALEAQTIPRSDFEVVILDDGSPDDTPKVLERLAAGTTMDLRWIRSEENRGQAAGRNTAWRAARAPLIAFTDDDCVPTPEWLESGLKASDDADAIVVGRTVPNPEQLDRLLRPFARTIEDEGSRFFNTCNIFYPRAALEAAGGFDESFAKEGGEDMDLAQRVLRAGGRAVQSPEALVYHDVHEGSLGGALHDTPRWTGIVKLIERYPDLRSLLVWNTFWKRSHAPVILGVAGIAAAKWRPAALALAAPWLYHRLKIDPFCPGTKRRVAALPGGFILDVAEVATMIRGSIRYRTFVL
jgi:GT2 family glycosyltransferase